MMTEEAKQGWKAVMLVATVTMTVSALTLCASISIPNSKPLPWLTAVSAVGFLGGLGIYAVGRVAIWWRDED